MRLLGAVAVALTMLATAAILIAAISGYPLYGALIFLGWLVVMVSLGLAALAHELIEQDGSLRK